MPQPQQQKLTKKQRKGLAFRQKISNKNTKGTKFGEPEDVPEADTIVNDELGTSENLDANSSDKRIKGNKSQQQQSNGANHDDEGERTNDVDGDASASARQTSNKRKRPQAEDAAPQADEDAPTTPPKLKKRKRHASEGVESIEGEDEQSQKHKTRYILFVGNLKYTTSKEAIQAHFAHIDPPPTIRLLTPKPSKSSQSRPATTSKSKGCTFLEFTNRTSLQQALKLHHSTLDGRQINVELTAGGGGKSAARLEKLKGRNQKLDSQRKKRLQKVSAKADSNPDAPNLDQPTSTPSISQRHSTISGSTIQPTKNRTWSIPEPGDSDQGITHRGGIKHANTSSNKKRGSKKRKIKDLGTGVNAIPVG